MNNNSTTGTRLNYKDTSTNTTDSNSNTNNDEYIDYSCSTSIERLTRDIETILHQWHVTNKCDRHISNNNNTINTTASSTYSSTTTTATTGSVSNATTGNTTNSRHWQQQQPKMTNSTSTIATNNASKNKTTSTSYVAPILSKNIKKIDNDIYQQQQQQQQQQTVLLSPNSIRSNTSSSSSTGSYSNSLVSKLSPSSSPSALVNGNANATTIGTTGRGTVTTGSSSNSNNNSSSKSTNNPLLLRSQIVNWNISFTIQTTATATSVTGTGTGSDQQNLQQQQQRVSVTNIPLHLALWDSPPTFVSKPIQSVISKSKSKSIQKHKQQQEQQRKRQLQHEQRHQQLLNGGCDDVSTVSSRNNDNNDNDSENNASNDNNDDDITSTTSASVATTTTTNMSSTHSGGDTGTGSKRSKRSTNNATTPGGVLASKLRKFPKKIFTSTTTKRKKKKNEAISNITTTTTTTTTPTNVSTTTSTTSTSNIKKKNSSTDTNNSSTSNDLNNNNNNNSIHKKMSTIVNDFMSSSISPSAWLDKHQKRQHNNNNNNDDDSNDDIYIADNNNNTNTNMMMIDDSSISNNTDTSYYNNNNNNNNNDIDNNCTIEEDDESDDDDDEEEDDIVDINFTNNNSTASLPYSIQQRRHNIVNTNNNNNNNNKNYNQNVNSINDIFSNFSTMFGIGQYITLSPIDPDRALYVYENNDTDDTTIRQQQLPVRTSSTDTTTTTTTKPFSNKNNPSNNNTNIDTSQRKPSMLYEYLSHSIVHRHYGTIPNTHHTTTGLIVNNNNNSNDSGSTLMSNNDSSASFSNYISTILSTWLQTSLHLASATTQCYFPLFGVWCTYEPTTSSVVSSCLSLNTTTTKQTFQSWINTNTSIPMTYSATNYSQRLISRYRFNVQQQQQQLLLLLQRSRQTTTKKSLSPPTKQQRTKIENNNNTSASKRQHNLKTQNTNTSSIVVIPASIAHASEHALFFNTIVPILTGTLQSEHCTSTFWLYSLSSTDVTYQYNLYRNISRLNDPVSLIPKWTFWGTLLQQHCLHHEQKRQQKQHLQSRRLRNILPSQQLSTDNESVPGSEENNSSTDFVNLWNARHTYIWHKSILPKSGLQRLLWLTTKSSDTEWRPKPMSTPYPNDVEIATGSGSSSHNDNGSTHSRSGGHVHYNNDKNNHNRQERRFTAYQKQCRQVALHRIDKAAGSSRSSPLWGPPDDPIMSMSATLTWENNNKSTINVTSDAATRHTQSTSTFATKQINNDPTGTRPLLALPLVSRHSMTESDWTEMEDATESAILDIHRPTTCTIAVQFDHETPYASAAATQRCVLAALIRTATLPKESLLSHTVDVDLMGKSDRVAGNKIAGILARKVGVDKTTAALVAAMDWATVVDEVIDDDTVESIVESVLSMSTTTKDSTNDGEDDSNSIFDNSPMSSYKLSSFPNPPEGFASNLLSMSSVATANNNSSTDPHRAGPSRSRVDDKMRKSLTLRRIWQPLAKGAPPGRLLSLLCVQMARVRTPCSMALIWMTFCKAIRRRWDDREILLNTNYIPGLDPLPSEFRRNNNNNMNLSYVGLDGGDNSNTCANAISTGGHASFAALVNSTEPDPDDMNCLIGQKLQVFNIGVEMLTTGDHYESNNFGPDTSSYNEEDSLLDTGERTGPGLSSHSSVSDDIDDFYDAAETEFISFDTFSAGERAFSDRRGARCPILGVGLHQSGEQLYAPYLQRALPLTDDVIAERRLMMYGQFVKGSTASKDSSTWQRLEVAHRLLKPKLLSDMQCFKAANPGATFHDFVTWYGNPTNPLSEDIEDLIPAKAGHNSDNTEKFGESSRAMSLTRDFWFTTWEEAKPIPAIEQGPLFDAESTVEMALDYLENIHPVSLLCQVMAVNLCSAYFAVVSSTGEALLIGIVSETLLQLREKIESALYLLSVDATRATGSISKATSGINEKKLRHQSSSTDKSSLSDTMMMISIDALAASSAACEAIGQAEVMVSRAASLLHKLDKQYDLIETILREREGIPIIVADHTAQQRLLSCIHQRQNEIPAMMSRHSASKILPATREYMLQNMDDKNPCQLCVRYNDEGIKVINDSTDGQAGTSTGRMLLSFAMTTNDFAP